jgi:hypothetical protein
MRLRKFITLMTEQDIEAACECMDRRERDAFDAFGDEIAECDDAERALVFQARSGRFDDAW